MPGDVVLLNLVNQVGALTQVLFVPYEMGMNSACKFGLPKNGCWLKWFHIKSNTTGGKLNPVELL